MSGQHAHGDMLPRGTLIIACGLVLFALAVTAAYRIVGVPPAASSALFRAENSVRIVQSRNLRFSDRADGAVVIKDVDSGEIAQVIEPGSQTGFVRAVMRGLARERRVRGIGEQPPFQLALWTDGELSLTDSATGRTTEMTAFGPSNRASFAELLGPQAQPAKAAR